MYYKILYRFIQEVQVETVPNQLKTYQIQVIKPPPNDNTLATIPLQCVTRSTFYETKIFFTKQSLRSTGLETLKEKQPA